MERPRHEFHRAVAIHVRSRNDDEMRRCVRQWSRGEILTPIILEAHQRHGVRFLPVIEATDRNDVVVPVTIEVHGDRAVGTGQVSETLERKLSLSLVFEPLDAMPGARTWP